MMPPQDQTPPAGSPSSAQSHGLSEKLIEWEYEHLTKSFLENETMGERRVTLYFAIVAALGGVLGIKKDTFELIAGQVNVPVLCTLVALFIFGWLTLARLANRNLETTRCLRGLSILRASCIEADENVEKFLAFKPTRGKPYRKKDWIELVPGVKGGLTECVAAINSLVAGGLFSLILFSAKYPWPLYLTYGILLAIAGWVGQFFLLRYRYQAGMRQIEHEEGGTWKSPSPERATWRLRMMQPFCRWARCPKIYAHATSDPRVRLLLRKVRWETQHRFASSSPAPTRH